MNTKEVQMQKRFTKSDQIIYLTVAIGSGTDTSSLAIKEHLDRVIFAEVNRLNNECNAKLSFVRTTVEVG